MPEDKTLPNADAVPVDCKVRPYATSVTWRNAEGGSWQQWHDDDDPMPTEWDDRPPDEVVHVYTVEQVHAMLESERERCARAVEQYGGAWDATTQNFARLIRALGPNVGAKAGPTARADGGK